MRWLFVFPLLLVVGACAPYGQVVERDSFERDLDRIALAHLAAKESQKRVDVTRAALSAEFARLAQARIQVAKAAVSEAEKYQGLRKKLVGMVEQAPKKVKPVPVPVVTPVVGLTVVRVAFEGFDPAKITRLSPYPKGWVLEFDGTSFHLSVNGADVVTLTAKEYARHGAGIYIFSNKGVTKL